jgi:hypothetical protein
LGLYCFTFCQVSKPLNEEIAGVVLDDASLRAEFISWISANCRKNSRKRNRLAFSETLELKMGGTSRCTLDSMAKKHK